MTSLHDAAHALVVIQARLRAHPLRYARLWDNPAPATSQRRALASASGCTALGVFGGNGSGKSEILGQHAVATALGSEDPDVQAWLAVNDLPAELVPPYPGRFLASGLTSNESRRVVRQKVAKYLPAGCEWRNEHGGGEAEVRLPSGGCIVFKSNDQGRRAYQGDEFDNIGLDEEHDLDVYRECLMRLGRRAWKAGWIGLYMTPLKGLTWVYRDFVSEPVAGNRAAWIHGKDNPHADQDRRATLLRQFGPHELAARERGEFTTLEGRVYVDWRRGIHVVEPFPAPKEWRRFVAIDFGTRNPCAILFAALDPADDTLHITSEWYEREKTADDVAAALRRGLDGQPEPEAIIADPEDRGARLSLARNHGIMTVAARKDVRAGISAVAERLHPDALGRPHLLVLSSCKNLVREIEYYVWLPVGGASANDGKEAPSKRDDHACDALRYLCRHLARQAMIGAS